MIDPLTQRAYLRVAREEDERLPSLISDVCGPEAHVPEAEVLIPPGIRRSQAALRRALPDLLGQEKLRGQWICYTGDERIGIASSKATLVRACLERGLDDDAFYVGKVELDEPVERRTRPATAFSPGGGIADATLGAHGEDSRPAPDLGASGHRESMARHEPSSHQ